jgi:hypothetical protein
VTIAIIGAVFVGWFALSVANQFDYFSQKIGRWDYLKLVPRWTFFAPNPGINDYHLVYRDRLTNGSYSAWREVVHLNSGDNISCLWNPQRRVTKTIADAVNNIMRVNLQIANFAKSAKFTLEYMLLLRAAQNEPTEGPDRQFAIIQTHGFVGAREAELLLLSELHAIDCK